MFSWINLAPAWLLKKATKPIGQCSELSLDTLIKAVLVLNLHVDYLVYNQRKVVFD